MSDPEPHYWKLRLSGATATDQPQTVAYLVETFAESIAVDLRINDGGHSFLRSHFEEIGRTDVETYVQALPREAERLLAGLVARFQFLVGLGLRLSGELPAAESVTPRPDLPLGPALVLNAVSV